MSTEVQETPAPTEAEAPATPAKAPKEPQRCKCSLYSKAVDENGETVLVELIACTATTGGNFAPGHDAKLKSALIGLGSTDESVYKTVNGEDVEMSAQDAANEYGFASKVASGIARAKEELATRDERNAAREAKKKAAEDAKAEKKAAREQAAAAKKAAADKAKAEKKAAADKAKAEKAAETPATDAAPATDEGSLF